MTKPSRITILLVATACFVLGIKVAQPQNKKDSLKPDASLSETIAWLKSNIPYSYVLPARTGGSRQERWTIGGLNSKGCTLGYDITIQEFGPEATSFQRHEWKVDLAALNPRMITIKPATKQDPVKIEFTDFNPHDPELIRQAQANGGVVVVKGKAIWQNYRMNDGLVREGFETRASFFTRNEERARELAAAFRQAIELCRQKPRD